MLNIKEHLGKKALLHNITAFICCRKVPASILLKYYDWAIEQREGGVYILRPMYTNDYHLKNNT